MGVRKIMEGTCRDVTLWRLTVHGVVSGVTKWLMPLFYISGTLFLSASLHRRRHGVTSLQVSSIIFRTLVIANPHGKLTRVFREDRISRKEERGVWRKKRGGRSENSFVFIQQDNSPSTLLPPRKSSPPQKPTPLPQHHTHASLPPSRTCSLSRPRSQSFRARLSESADTASCRTNGV